MNFGDIVAIVVAIIAFIGVLISTYTTNKTTKRINESNNKLQEKWNQKNIDANLIASARIEWIQKVRNLSAELLSLYFSILNYEDADKIQVTFSNTIEKTELLILYFGHEDNVNADESCLLNKETNAGKNEQIVQFVISLSQKFNKHNAFVQDGGLTKLQKSIKDARKEMYNNAEMVKIGECYNEDADDMMDMEEPRYQTDDIIYVTKLEAREVDKKTEITNLQNDLIFFRNIIRTYLKIEWNKAKSVE